MTPSPLRTARRSIIATRWSSPIAVAATGALMLLSACASTSAAGDDVASLGTSESSTNTADTVPTSIDPQDAFVEYTKCMRAEGIDLPDPQVISSGDKATSGQVIQIGDAGGGDADGPHIDVEGDEFKAAEAKCKPILDQAVGDIEIDPKVAAEQREQMLDFAQCMRDHGIDFPDPVFSDNGGMSVSIGTEGSGPPPDIDSDAMQKASEECGQDMGGGLVINAKANG